MGFCERFLERVPTEDNKTELSRKSEDAESNFLSQKTLPSKMIKYQNPESLVKAARTKQSSRLWHKEVREKK